MPAAPVTTGAPVGKKLRGEHEQARGRVEIAGLTGLDCHPVRSKHVWGQRLGHDSQAMTADRESR